jgi:hypothetical protein
MLDTMPINPGTNVTFQIPHKIPSLCIVDTVRSYSHEYLPTKVIFHTDSDAGVSELSVIRSDSPYTLIAASPIDSAYRDMARKILDSSPYLWLQTDGEWWSKSDVILHSAPLCDTVPHTRQRMFMTGIVDAKQNTVKHITLTKS